MRDFEKAISFDNLYNGLKASCNGVRWKNSTIGYEANALKNTYKLRQDLLNGTYKLQPYQMFRINEPKERDIVATRIRDRQFQHSMVDNIVYFQLTDGFVESNCACQKGRGIDYCVDIMKKYLRMYYLDYGTDGWVLKCDIKSYFANIRHDVAKEIVNRRISDADIRKELYRIIDSYQGDCGLGLGSQVNQLLALAVLDDLDHFIVEVLHIQYYVRYMDDFILVHPDKEYLKRCREKIEKHLSAKGLALSKKKTTLSPLSQGFKLLKWKFMLKPSGKVILRMDRKKVLKQKKKIMKLWEREQKGLCKPGTCDMSMNSWMANARRGDTYSERREMAQFYFKLTGRRYHDYVKRRETVTAVGSDCVQQSDGSEYPC